MSQNEKNCYAIEKYLRIPTVLLIRHNVYIQ